MLWFFQLWCVVLKRTEQRVDELLLEWVGGWFTESCGSVMYWAWKLTQCSAWHLRQSTFKYAKQHFTINRGGNRLDRLVKKYDPTLSCEDCCTTPSIWGKFTVFLRVLPDKMTVWGKMWWENSCGGWPRQSRCVCVQGHLLTWHIYNPLSDVWKGYKLGILISKTHIGASNTSHQRQRQFCGRVLSFCCCLFPRYLLILPPWCCSFCPLWTTNTAETPPLLFSQLSLEHVTQLCVEMWTTYHLMP